MFYDGGGLRSKGITQIMIQIQQNLLLFKIRLKGLHANKWYITTQKLFTSIFKLHKTVTYFAHLSKSMDDSSITHANCQLLCG